jgi:hypothetical protein
MPKGIPKKGVNNGWFKEGHISTGSPFIKGHKLRVELKHSDKTKTKNENRI